MKYKLLAVDLDETLLDEHSMLTPRGIAAIRAAHDRGAYIVIATGRMLRASIPFIEALEIDDMLVISYVGALISTMKGEVLYSHYLDPAAAHRLYEYCHKEGLHLQFYSHSDFIYEKEGVGSDVYAELTGLPGKCDPAFMRDPNVQTAKALIVHDADKLLELKERMIPLFPEFYVGRSRPMFLEFTSPEISKGKALKKLCERLSVTAEECVAIGDNDIDLSMIEYAGMGVAMGNGNDAVKAAAQYITASNREDGVAQAVEKLFLEE